MFLNYMKIRDTNQIRISDKDKNESPGVLSLYTKPVVVPVITLKGFGQTWQAMLIVAKTF